MSDANRRAPIAARGFLPAFAVGLVGLSFVTGLLAFPSSFVFPYVVPKVLFFRAVSMLLAGLLLLAAPRLGIRWTPITAAVGLFLLSATLSTVTSIDRHRSLWDTHERMLGLFTLLHYGVFYLAATTLVRDRRSWLVLLRTFLAMSILIIALGVAQGLFPDLLGPQGSTRVGSTLGNPIYLGDLGATTVFVGFLRWDLGGRGKRIETALACILGIVGVGITESRGSVLALATGLGVLAVCHLAVVPHGARGRRLFGALAISVLVSVAALFMLRHAPGFESIPGLGRFAGVTLDSSGVRTRILAWDIALDAFEDRPFLGWGPCNFYYAFNRHYRPELLEFGWTDTWFDSSHNAPLDALVHQGMLGLMAYLAMLATPPILLWRAYRRGALELSLPCAASALLAAHLVQRSFVFETSTSYLYLMFFLAYFNRSLEGFAKRPASSWPPRPRLAAIAMALAAGWMIWRTDLEPARANQLARDAILAAKYGDPIHTRLAYDRAVASEPVYVDGVRALFGVTLIERLNRSADARSPALQELGRFAYEELGKALERHPHDVRLSLHRARLALLLAKHYGDLELLRPTEEELEAGIDDSPRRQEIRFLLSATKLLLGKPREAIPLLEVAIGAAPRVAEGWWRLALVYKAQDRSQEARRVLQQAQARGVRFRPPEDAWVAEILEEPAE